MKKAHLVCYFIVCGLLAACSAVKVVEPKRYELSGISKKQLYKKPTSRVVYVSDIKASSAYNTSDMLYTTKPLMLSAFSQNEWIASPAKMLRPLLVTSLQNTGYFKGVLSSGNLSNARYQVNATLLQLRQNFIKDPSRLNMAIKVDVIDTKHDKVLASRRFSQNIATKQASPYGGVMAANEATKNLMTQISLFVVQSTQL